jgi:hypothetical protein
MERFESGPLSQTVGSPGGPKVHEYHLPFERPQGHFLTFQVWQTDLWQRNSTGKTLETSGLKEF